VAWVSADERRYIAHVAHTVGGWLTEAEGAFLYALAARGPEAGAIVEIGSNRGKSTTLLAKAARIAGRERVHAIDPHRGGTEAEFRGNLAREHLDDWVIPHVAKSQEFVHGWREPIRLLFIDGLHTYEGVRADYADWVPFVVPGGVIALHDTFQWEGPRRLVEETILDARDTSLIGIVDSITAVQKLPRRGVARSVRHAGLRLSRSLYLWGRRRKLPGDLRRASKRLLHALSRPPSQEGRSAS
jgi:predicted O-methyltransferase YrrM